jgi:bifunctional DNA-binding transcriptional regulator/antitoxin component of YhaV-PrlF toxin-antitoxin module
MRSKYKFKAMIQEGERGGAFVFFPFDMMREFGTKSKVAVNVTFDGEPDKSALMPYGYPQHMIGVPKALREKIKKKPGDYVEVAVSKDETVRTVEIPPDFQRRMEKEKILTFFEGLSYTHRKEYVRWITEAKKEETRKARFEKAIELLKKNTKTPF